MGLQPVRVAVVGAGSFGRNHLRVLHQNENARLVAVVDIDSKRAGEAASQYECAAVTAVDQLAGMEVDAAVVATPTVTHADVGCSLMEAGIDILVEKPIAHDLASARRLIEAAARYGRVLQVGHLERFNPAVAAMRKMVTRPLFFEVHRLSLFSPRSLDVDVVLDLMIHDIDVVLAFTGLMPEETRAAGISILSEKVDIANVRLAFPGGCICNLTASRVSTERVRKIRLFQPRQYLSLDYARQDLVAFEVSEDRQIGFQSVTVEKDEPLKLELASFLHCVRSREAPPVSGEEAGRALAVALEILDKIEEHGRAVAQSLEHS
jgi:predicted dehydrogenase